MMTDASLFKAQWTMGKVIATYPGKDGIVRAVDVQTETVKSTNANKPTPAHQLTTRTSIFRRPVSKLALLLPASTGVPVTRP